MPKPIVAIVGRPNVGKSTLFNRLIGDRLAVVDDTPGTTRDRQFAEAEWNGVRFDVVDSGDFIPQIRAQAELAIAEANAVIFVTDIVTGPTAADHEVADTLRVHR